MFDAVPVSLERPSKNVGDEEIPVRMSVWRDLLRRILSLRISRLFDWLT
jgi:hypothetical protein